VDPIEYRYGNTLDLDAVIELYAASRLGERRPIGNRATMARMLEHGNLTVTAWDGATMIGIARTLTDFAYCGYLSDLAVRESYQKRGIGVELIRKTREAMGPEAMLILLSAPAAVEYYPHIGFTRHDSAWVLRAGDRLPPPRA
jgi:GNAT superfamily N-acetyltransferase